MRRINNGFGIFQSFNYAFMTLLAVCTLFPFYLVIINSVSPGEDFIFKDIILFPSRFDFMNYVYLLGPRSGLLTAYKVTLFVTVVGTVLEGVNRKFCA